MKRSWVNRRKLSGAFSSPTFQSASPSISFRSSNTVRLPSAFSFPCFTRNNNQWLFLFRMAAPSSWLTCVDRQCLCVTQRVRSHDSLLLNSASPSVPVCVHCFHGLTTRMLLSKRKVKGWERKEAHSIHSECIRCEETAGASDILRIKRGWNPGRIPYVLLLSTCAPEMPWKVIILLEIKYSSA